jgi:hypothetical protein
MRASPAFQVSVTRFGVWRVAVLSVLVPAAAVLIAWLVSRDEFTPLWWQLLVGSAGLLLLTLGATLIRVAPMSLRWDTAEWHLGPAASAGNEPWHGRLAVAIDLGPWMLLRFDHDAATRRRRITWLPVQRNGLQSRWHALRCAVYCARPEPGLDAGLSPANAHNSKNERP